LESGLDERARVWIDLEPGDVYSYNFLVDPKRWNRGIGTALIPAKDAFLQRLNVRRAITIVGLGNLASRRIVEKTGGQPIKIIYLCRVFGKRFQFEKRLKASPDSQ